MKCSLPVLLCVMLLARVQPVGALHFVIYGDTRTNLSTHQTVIGSFSAVNPDLVLHTGDLYDGYTEAEFKTAITSRPNIATLLNNNLFLVARGNHETEAAVLAFSPPIVRNDSILYSFTDGNCFFVCAGYDPAQNLAWTQSRLQSVQARNAAWRIVYSHVPVYSTGAGHGAAGIPGFESLCDQFHVTMVFSGHDHIYERSKQVFARASVNATRDLSADSGTVYVVAGGGGAPLYTAGANWWTAVSSSVNHWCELTSTADRIKMVARWVNGTGFDSVTIHKAGIANIAGGHHAGPGRAGMGTDALRRVLVSGHVMRIETSLPGMLSVFGPRGDLCHYADVLTADTAIHAFLAENPGIYMVRMKSKQGSETRKVIIK
jgi:predicted phosphodiesterase